MRLTDARTTPWRWLILLAALLVGGAIAARALGLEELFRLHNLAKLKDRIEAYGPLAPWVLITGYILAVILFIPGLPITVLGGIAFGPIWGTVYVSIASTIGAALALLIARYGARGSVERWVERSPRLAKMDQAVARHGWRIVMITRLVPVIPFNVQNYAYGLTRIGFTTYFLISWTAMLPATVAFTLAGGALSEGGDYRRTLIYLGIAGILLVTISLVPQWMKRRSRVTAGLL